MSRRRYVTRVLLLCLSLCTRHISAQGDDRLASPMNQTGKNELEMITIGHGNLPSGHPMSFRIYVDSEGIRGGLTYSEFTSLHDAEQQISEWLKLTQRITSREHNKTEGGQLISDRVVASGRNPESGKKEFFIIRRDAMNCFFIQSSSLDVAMRVEGMISKK